ncbi:MAG: hypothetical protein WAL59_14595 [Roseiarcus sp.]
MVAGLPRSEERITRREHVSSLAINASSKYLFLILFGDHPALLFGKAAPMFTLAHVGHLAMLRRKATAAR